MHSLSFRRQVAYTLLLFTLLLLLVPRAGYSEDVEFWMCWAGHILQRGLSTVYEVPDNNYNPFYHYILWLYGKLAGSPERLYYYRHSLKAITLVFDFAGAFWAASLVQQREQRFGLALLLLLNIGYVYNTLIWEQVDAIYTFFVFGAVVLAARRRAVGSALLFVLAIAAKTQAIIFLPPLLLLWAPLWWQQPKQLLRAATASVLLATLILAPFIWGSPVNYLPRILAVNLTAAQVYPVVSMNAFNFWHLLPSTKINIWGPDSLRFAGLTYRHWGLLLFFAASAVVLLPLLLNTWRRLRQPASSPATTGPSAYAGPDLALVLLSCGLIPLVFSFFNTQMHERYWHAAVLFLAAYGFLRRDYLPYILVSAAYFLNLEGILHFLGLLKYSAIFFKTWFIAALFLLTIVLSLVRLYRLAAERRLTPALSLRNKPAIPQNDGL